MYKLFLLVFFQLAWNQILSQNLVPNPSFEKYLRCPSYSNTNHNAHQEPFGPENWVQPVNASPDYLNFCGSSDFCSIPLNCFGNQYPKSGNAYIGIIAYSGYRKNYSELLQCPLIDSLDSNQLYYLEFYVSKAEQTKFCTDRIHCLFSKDSISSAESYFDFESRKDSSAFTWTSFTFGKSDNYSDQWIKLSTTFRAKGGERFLTVGNFDHTKTYKRVMFKDKRAKTSGEKNAYYFLDNFYLVKLDSEGVCENKMVFTDTTTYLTFKKDVSDSLILSNLRREIILEPTRSFSLEVVLLDSNDLKKCLTLVYDKIYADPVLADRVFMTNNMYSIYNPAIVSDKRKSFKKTGEFVIKIVSD